MRTRASAVFTRKARTDSKLDCKGHEITLPGVRGLHEAPAGGLRGAKPPLGKFLKFLCRKIKFSVYIEVAAYFFISYIT